MDNNKMDKWIEEMNKSPIVNMDDLPAQMKAKDEEIAKLKAERDDYRQRLIDAYKWIYQDIAHNQYSIKVSKRELKALGVKFDKDGDIIKTEKAG